MRSPLRFLPLVVIAVSLAPIPAGADDVALNEIGAAASSFTDEDGESSDWIEIHNRSDQPIGLRGWSLTDNPRRPHQWVFPDVTIAAHGYFVVIASGKDRKNPGAPLHTNFKLAQSGEYLALLRPLPATQVVSDLAPLYPVQRAGYSYGLTAGPDSYRYLSPPTPGAANDAATTVRRAALADLRFEPPRGFYHQPLRVEVSSPDPGATIYYTRDGSVPREQPEQRYRGPLLIDQPTVVRARAFRPEHVPSPTATHTYLVGLSDGEIQLPVLSVATDPGNLTGPSGIVGMSDDTREGKPGVEFEPPWDEATAAPGAYFNPIRRGPAWERPVSVELLHADRRPGFQIDAGLRLHASSLTRTYAHLRSKFSYRLYFRSEYGQGELDYPLIPGVATGRFRRLVLRGGNDDFENPFIRDELLRRVWSDMGHLGARGTFVHLFINGVLKGYYNPAEHIDQQTLERWTGSGASWDIIKQRHEVVAGDDRAWQQVLALAPAGFPPVTDRFAAIAQSVDLTSFCDYLLLNLYAATWDWPDNNWFAVRPRPDGKFSFLAWDAEGAFGFDREVDADTIQTDLHYVRKGGSDLPQLFLALLESGGTDRLIGPDARWRYAKGERAFSEPADAWLGPDFDDSGWTEGEAPIGYGDGDERTALGDMANRYPSVAIRTRFRVADPEQLSQLILSVEFDDGFVAWLNGREVARSGGLRGAGELPDRTLTSSEQHEAGGRHHAFDISAHRGALVAGDNVLCVQGHNAGLDSSDFSLHPVLTGYVFAHDHPFRALFRQRVQHHMFGDGALTDRRLYARYEELKAILEPVIPAFDLRPGSSISADWLARRRAPFLEQLRRHGLWWRDE